MTGKSVLRPSRMAEHAKVGNQSGSIWYRKRGLALRKLAGGSCPGNAI